MRKGTTLAISAALLPGVLTLGACSSSAAKPAAGGVTTPGAAAATSAAANTSNVGLSSAALTAAMKTALTSATAVHVKGTVTEGGQSISMDVQLNGDGSGAGTFTIGTDQFPFIAAGGTTYIELTSGLASLAGLSTSSGPAALLLNKWVPSTNPQISSFTDNLSTDLSLTAFIKSNETSGDTFTADGTSTVGGVPTAQYKDSNSNPPPTVFEFSVPATGPALPMQEVGTGTSSGTIDFTWNEPTKVTPPPANQIYSGS